MRKALIEVILLLVVIAAAFLLRTYQISGNPPSLSWDEVSIGYNAYSVLLTGHDEHGRFLPIDTFVAYGDYKPPLAIYLTVPFVAMFGLSELAVRLPSALLGTVTVFLAYVLVRELFRQKSRWLPLLTAGILAVSPWHINLSRAGFEANIALCFAVLGVWLVLRARSAPKVWYAAWVPFVAAIYTFNSSRVFTILLTFALILFTMKYIRKNMKQFVVGVVIAVLLLLPIVPHLLSPEARLRFAEVNIFTDASVVESSNARIAREPDNLIGKLVNNRRVGYARSYLLHFMDNFQPQFLFITGDGNPKFSIQDVGQLYMLEAPFLVIGIIALLRTHPAIAALLLWWLIAAVIPAATARETPHALRILNSLPTWQIFIAFGIMTSAQYLKRRWFIIIILLAYSFSVTYYVHTYYRHYPVEFSGEWQYGYREAIRISAPIESKYDHVVISDNIGRPYMYTLFYTRTDPRDLLRTRSSYFDASGFYHVEGFGKYRFGGTLPESLDSKTLYIWDTGAVPEGARVIDTVYLLNGNPVLTVFDGGSVRL